MLLVRHEMMHKLIPNSQFPKALCPLFWLTEPHIMWFLSLGISTLRVLDVWVISSVLIWFRQLRLSSPSELNMHFFVRVGVSVLSPKRQKWGDIIRAVPSLSPKTKWNAKRFLLFYTSKMNYYLLVLLWGAYKVSDNTGAEFYIE